MNAAIRSAFWAAALGLGALLTTSSGIAGGEFQDYSTEDSYRLELPVPAGGYFVLTDSFPAETSTMLDGFPLAGRMIAAGGAELLVQNNYGSSQWLTVGVTPSTMDPTFIRVSPSGNKIALGPAWMAPLYVVPTDALDSQNPPDVTTVAGVIEITGVEYYDAAWYDDRYLLVNEGWFTGSQVYALDTEAESPERIVVVSDIPGASGGVAVDGDGNVVTGVGMGDDTGQLKVWSPEEIQAILEATPAVGEQAPTLDYVATGHVVADQALSAAFLGFDGEGNLHAGGGDVFGATGEVGYAVLIDSAVIDRALDGGAAADPTNPAEFLEISPDPCRNDMSVAVHYVDSLKMLAVALNMTGADSADADGDGVPDECSAYMEFGAPFGEALPVQVYFPPSAPDTDGDGVPDGMDNAYLIYNPDQVDDDGDGFGDRANVDWNDDGIVDGIDLSMLVDVFRLQIGDAGFDTRFDLDGSGVIDFGDTDLLIARWGQTPPYY